VQDTHMVMIDHL